MWLSWTVLWESNQLFFSSADHFRLSDHLLRTIRLSDYLDSPSLIRVLSAAAHFLRQEATWRRRKPELSCGERAQVQQKYKNKYKYKYRCKYRYKYTCMYTNTSGPEVKLRCARRDWTVCNVSSSCWLNLNAKQCISALSEIQQWLFLPLSAEAQCRMNQPCDGRGERVQCFV